MKPWPIGRGFFGFKILIIETFIYIWSMQPDNTIETMDYILTNFNWWVGYCNENTAKTIRKRHKERKLSKGTYEKVFAFKGFKLIWSR